MSDTLYLIGGMHRNGTSALASGLYASGLSMEFEQQGLELLLPGQNLEGAPKDEYDLYEIRNIYQFNERLLGYSSGAVDNPPLEENITIKFDQILFILSVFDFIPKFPFAIKDPRFTFTFSIWKKVLNAHHKNLKVVPLFAVRSPLEGAMALKKREHVYSVHGGLDLWLRYNLQVRNVSQKNNGLIIIYDGKRESFLSQMETLCEKLNLPFSEAKISQAFKPASPVKLNSSELENHPLKSSIEDLFEDLTKQSLLK